MRWRAALLGPAAVVAVAASAQASVVLQAGVEELAGLSQLVVEGRVSETSVLFETETGRIWTRYRVQVAETLHGEAAEAIWVHVPGGSIGDRSQNIHGAAHLKDGQEVVLFLWTDKRGRHRVLGAAQGAFHVKRGKDGGKVCRNRVRGLVLLDRRGARVQAKSTEVALGALKQRVKDARRRIAEARARRMEQLRQQAEADAKASKGKPGGTD